MMKRVRSLSCTLYKAAMDVVNTINKMELLCLPLFTIDDESVKYNHNHIGMD